MSTISGNSLGKRFQLPLEIGVADQLVAGFDGGGLALDVGEDVGDFGHVAAHVGFQFGDLIMGALQGHAFVEFDVLFDVEATREILHADVVDVEVVAGGDGANAVENIFRALGARQRLHGDVGIGKDVANRGGHGFDQLLGALEGDGAGETNGKIGEVAVAGAADAHATDFEHAIDARDGVGDLGADAGGSGVEQGVNGAARQPPAHRDDDAGDEQSGNGIGAAQPIQMIDAAQQNRAKAEHDHARGPDVGGEMQGVGFESLAFVFRGDAAEGARTPPVHSHGDQHHGECPDRRFDFDVAEKQAHDRFVDDPGAGQQKQAGFNEGGKIFDFAVAILVVGVGGLVGNSDGEIGEQRGDQIERGVRGFGEDSQGCPW